MRLPALVLTSLAGALAVPSLAVPSLAVPSLAGPALAGPSSADPLTATVITSLPTATARPRARVLDSACADQDARDDFRRRLDQAGEDTSRLWELREWCREHELEREAGLVERRILELEPDHEQMNLALGRLLFEDQWFDSQRDLDRWLERREEERALAKGYVIYKKQWIHPDERDFLKAGMRRDPLTGQWLSRREQRQLEKGWLLQDYEWIAPEERAHVEAGEWRIHGEWYTLDEANRQHAELDSMWRIPTPEFDLWSTASRNASLQAAAAMSGALVELRRIFGVEPAYPLKACVLRSEQQYDNFAAGDPGGARRPAHASNLHTIHSAFLAESWFDSDEGVPRSLAMGTCLWEELVPYGDRFGYHAARLAAGISYVDAIDPSPKAVADALDEGPGPDFHVRYMAEKALPEWLRWGAAVYASRFFRDPDASAELGPWWARDWSLDNLRNHGRLRPIDEILAFELDPSDRADAQKLLLEAGLLVAYMLDGGYAPLELAHADLKEGLAARRPVELRLERIEELLREQRDAIIAFGQL